MSMLTFVVHFGQHLLRPCPKSKPENFFLLGVLLELLLALCLRIYVCSICARNYIFLIFARSIMGNEGSLPSETESQASDWQSLYSYGSRAGRRSSLGSMRIPSPMDPPEPDLSHLSPEEVAKIREVIGRAREMKDEEHKRIRKLEEEYVAIANDVERRATEAVAGRELRKESPLCPICLQSELHIQEGKMKDGQNVCVDCGNLICLNCGSMEQSVTSKAVAGKELRKESPLCPICLQSELHIQEGKMKDGPNVCVDCGNLICLNCCSMKQSVTSKEMEWVCQVCHKRRQLVLSSGLWHPGCDVDDDIPLAKEIEHRLDELGKASAARGPLVRSASLDAPEGAIGGPSLQRQLSLPDYHGPMSSSYTQGHTLEVIQESGHSGNVSENVSPEPGSNKTDSPEGSDEMKKSTSSVGGNSLRAMGQPSSRSESEYSDGPSDVDMPDVSMFRSGDGISPDDGSDDYSFMSIGSSDDNSGFVRRKHRPKSLNLSRSISATSSEDETSDSAISTDAESKYGGVPPPDPHEIRIALAASAFVEEMRVDLGNETDDEVAELSALEEANDGAKIRFSPSAPVSPSWREGLESPPFSPRRRDSYPGKRRGSSPVSPKDAKFTYSNESSPPSRQRSLEDLYDKESHATDDQSHGYIAQRLSPKSPEELKDSYYGATSDMILPYDRPTSNLKKSKPFYSLDESTVDLNDTTTVMDLATYAATVASNTANLTSMTVSPTNLDSRTEISDLHDRVSPDSLGTSSPVSPGYYDNVSYPEERQEEEAQEEAEGDAELADPSQKPIDYQGTKRQKARPPTTDWSPVIDLSPILDVSPSLEEAEQAEMLAQQQEERQRQASREDDEYSPEAFTGAASGATGVDYMYYGLKRYEVVENITELLKQNNGKGSPDIATLCTNDSDETRLKTVANAVSVPDDKFIPPTACSTSVPPKLSETAPTSVASNSVNRVIYSGDNGAIGAQKTEAVSSPKGSLMQKSESPVTKKPDEPKDNSASSTPTKNKARRKLPEPTAEIIATQKAPVPKPRRKDRPPDSQTPPPKPSRTSKQDTKEPSRAAPTLVQSNPPNKPPPNKPPPRPLVRKQDSDERKRTARDMKAKPDPVVMSHIATEEASACPQYKVLESPPSPENKAAIRREYSDSTSVSPSSSPDREVYLYPSPVTPPDSDSSPPKPHSPSSGTDFEEEFAYVDESPRTKSRNSKHSNHQDGSQNDKDGAHSKSKQASAQQREHKSKEMKKVRRKLPPIPAEEETAPTNNSRAKSRPVPPRKPPPKADSRYARKKPGTSSTSDDSSMNEDDKEVASITRKKSINDLDKPSLDKRNGNYITVVGTTNGVLDVYRPDDGLQVNIPPDTDTVVTQKYNGNMVKYFDETDEIIDSMINIYGAPITQAMKGLKKRLQEELRRVTEGRRRKIDEIEELRALKIQLNEMKIGADKNRSSNKGSLSSGSNGKKRSNSNSRTSPQLINRRARHKRQSSDPMVAKFSPIKEDKDIESEMQVVTSVTSSCYQSSDDSRSCRTADDSSQSGVSDTESTRSEPVFSAINKSRQPRNSDYAKMFYSKHAQSTETLDRGNNKDTSHMISSHSEGNLPKEDEEFRIREEKRRELQFEIEKRKKQLAEKQAQLRETRASLGATNNNTTTTQKPMTQSCDEITDDVSVPAFIPPRPIPTGIIKPIDDDEEDSISYKSSYTNQSYSSTEYLAHKQEELMRQRFDGLSSFSSPFLYNAESGEKSAFVPQITRNTLDYSYSTGNVNVGRDKIISASATLPNIPTSRQDLENNNRPVSDTESSPPSMSTPAMPLLIDIKDRSRKIIHDIGTGSRPVSAEFNVGVEDLMNGMYRVESDNSVDADEPIMKHMMEGGVTILKQLERRKQPAPCKPKKYEYPVKRILLTTDPKEKSGRPGNSIGMKIIGGKSAPGTNEVGAYVSAIYKGGVADQLHGEVSEGDQILEWNGIELTGRSYEEVQQIIANPNGEIELVIRTLHNSKKTLGDSTAQAPSCHSSYDNLDSDEETDAKAAKSITQGIDPRQLAAKLEFIEEDESPSISHSSSQHDYNTASASSGCSSPLSEPTSTSSEHHSRGGPRRPVSTATATVAQPVPTPRISLTAANDTRQRIVNQDSPARNTSPNNRPASSPLRRASSPNRRAPSPNRRAPSPNRNRRSSSPGRRAPSPNRRAVSPNRRSSSPGRRGSPPNRRASSPNRRAPSPNRRAPSPNRRAPSPNRRAPSPNRRAQSPNRRSSSPNRRASSPTRRAASPIRVTSSPHQSSPSPHQPSPSPQHSHNRITPSSSEYSNLKRNHSNETPPKVKSNSLDAPPYPTRNDSVKSKSPTERCQREGSQRKRDLSQQSSSFDDFLRMSRHAGVDERPQTSSPTKGRGGERPASKRGLSASTSELADHKRNENTAEIQKSLRGSSRGDRQMGDIQLQLAHDEGKHEFRVYVRQARNLLPKLQLAHDDGKHEFRVYVRQARNLLPKDINGLSDPFVKIYLLPGRCSDNKRRTKHIPRTLNPEWHETIVFPNVHDEELRNKTLEITVWDYDRFKNNDFLGEVVLDLSERAFMDNVPHWYPLCDHDPNKGLDLPQATVLPPRATCKSGSASPRSKSRDRGDKHGHSPSPIGNSRNDRVRSGLGRRRRSFDTLQDVDKV